MTGRRTIVQFAFRFYTAAYIAILGFAALGDLAGSTLQPATLAPHVASLVGLGLLGFIGVVGWAGRKAVALRPSAAELQLALLSPVSRVQTLRRPIVSSLAITAGATAALGFVLMVISPAHFAGLGVAGRLCYLGFAGGIGALAFATHLLVAQQRGTPLGLAGAAIALTLLTDALRESGQSALSAALRGIVERSQVPAFPAIVTAAGTAIWVAWRQADRLSLERIARGSDASDKASLALAGNDIRSLMLVLRAFGAQPWRQRPLLVVPTGLALRYPATTRSLRSIARWRLSRWVSVLSLTCLSAAMLTSGAPTTGGVALAALLLWALGLSLNEPLAQEHDHRERLELLPSRISIELRLIGVGWLITFLLVTVALATQIQFVAALFLGSAATSAATITSTMSLRATWKLLLGPASLGMPSEAVAGQMLYRLARPMLVGCLCLATWRLGMSGPAIAAPGIAILAVLVMSIVTNNFERMRLAIGRAVIR